MALTVASVSSSGGPVEVNQQFQNLIEQKREAAGLISLAALVMQDGKTVTNAAVGERKKGSDVAVTIEDQWHTGSISKSFTATLIAKLVEEKHIRWDATVGDLFGDEDIDGSWQDVTLVHLLTHTSGAPANFSIPTMLFKKPDPQQSLKDYREAEVLKALKKPTQSPPGAKFKYSNLGYTIAAAMVERVTGVQWNALMQDKVFKPLQLNSAGFGPPKDGGNELEQPRGHRRFIGIALAADENADNSPLIAPAGGIHMTLADVATYGNDHLKGEQGEGTLLSTESYRRLHTAQLNDYAYGWVIRPAEEWSQSPVYWHNGSNGLWYMLVAFIPAYNAVVTVATNDGKISVAEKTAWEIIKAAVDMLDKPSE